jgi:predicted RNase H-like HicB family nuclease
MGMNASKIKSKRARTRRKPASRRYEIILSWSEIDKAVIATVPELPGCMADGPDYQAALANAETVIREWIDTARQLGRPIPVPRGRLMFA